MIANICIRLFQQSPIQVVDESRTDNFFLINNHSQVPNASEGNELAFRLNKILYQESQMI